MSDNAALTHAVFDALEAGDFGRFASCFQADAVVWHNFDGIDQPIAEVADVLGQVIAGEGPMTYEERRYLSLPGGAVAQHVVRIALADGSVREVPAMLRIHVRDGLISRIEEYFDSAQAGRPAPG